MVEEQQDYITDLEEECENLQEQNRLLVEKVKFMNQEIKVEQTINNLRISLIYLEQSIEYAENCFSEQEVERLKILYNMEHSQFLRLQMMSEERED